MNSIIGICNKYIEYVRLPKNWKISLNLFILKVSKYTKNNNKHGPNKKILKFPIKDIEINNKDESNNNDFRFILRLM